MIQAIIKGNPVRTVTYKEAEYLSDTLRDDVRFDLYSQKGIKVLFNVSFTNLKQNIDKYY